MADVMPIANIQAPAQTLAMADSDGTGWLAPTHTCIGFKPPASQACATTYARMQPRHNEGANLAFFDGHAKWWKDRAIIADFNSGALKAK
jgi:prepilin-type processing-associated H-X9-DG protein